MKFKYSYYYLTLLVLSLFWVLLGKQFHNNFAPFIFFIFGFPVFGFLYFSNLSKFSSLLKNKEPELFKRNKVEFGYFKDELVSGITLFNSTDFNNLIDTDLKSSFKILKSNLNYMLFSFVSFGIISILTIFIK